jgi:GNAT superfamily N-acetyltransferase
MNDDARLAQRLERAEARFAGGYALARGGATHDVAGGTAIFAGVGSPFGKAVGIGIGQPVTAADMDALELHLGPPPRIELCPFAHESLARELSARGYVIVEWNHVLVGPMPKDLAPYESYEGSDANDNDPARVEVRAVRKGEEAIWARVVNQGFSDKEEVSDADITLALPSTRTSSIHCVLAWRGNEAIGASAFGVHDGIVSLFGSAVRVAWRRRGAQRAFIHSRLAFAKERGCDLVTACTLPGTGSQRNLERWGLRVAYPKVLMQRG